MEWIRLTSEDLEYALNKPQLETLKAESLRNLKRDIAQDVLNTVVARIRAEISASGLNWLDADHSRIPYELRDCALRLAVEEERNYPFPEQHANENQSPSAWRFCCIRTE